MIYLLVSDDSLFHRMVSETFLQEEEVWSWAGRKKNGEAWPGPGAAFYGDPGDPETFSDVVPDPNNWRYYRYRVYERTVPVRNMVWGTAP